MVLPLRYIEKGPVGFRSIFCPANEPDSGQMPESRMPTTTPAPALSTPPLAAHTPGVLLGPTSPRNSGDLYVSRLNAVSLTTIMTSRDCDRSVACLLESRAVKELAESVERLITSAPTPAAMPFWRFVRYAW